MSVKMSISAAKRMGVVSTTYDTKGKKVLSKTKIKKNIRNKPLI